MKTLSVISGVLELLGLEKLGEREARYVASAASSSEMLIALINDALDITRVETGDITLNRVRFSLREILEQAVSMIEPLVHHKGLTISIDFDVNLDRIYIADKVRLSQIVTNLLSNALKYTLVLHKISSPEAYRAVYKGLHGIFTGLSLVTLGEIQEKGVWYGCRLRKADGFFQVAGNLKNPAKL